MNWARKRRTALLVTRRPPAQTLFFFKMSDKSEHSDSEISYPGEMSDAELPSVATCAECTERKSTLLMNEEVHKSGHMINAY